MTADITSLILFMALPFLVVFIAAIAQLYVRNTLIVTGVIFIVLLIISVLLSFFFSTPWAYFGAFAVAYYLLSYFGTLVGTLVYKGYERRAKKKKQNESEN